MILATTLTAATTAALATVPGIGWAWVAVVPLAITGPWLAAVDLDVCRIPNRTLASTAAATIAALIGLAAVGNTTQAITGTIGGIIAGALFAILHAATRGGIGFGDVKLVTVIGLAIGPLGLPIAWMALITGPIAAVIWAKLTRQQAGFAYGPWLLLGAWIAAATALLI